MDFQYLSPAFSLSLSLSLSVSHSLYIALHFIIYILYIFYHKSFSSPLLPSPFPLLSSSTFPHPLVSPLLSLLSPLAVFPFWISFCLFVLVSPSPSCVCVCVCVCVGLPVPQLISISPTPPLSSLSPSVCWEGTRSSAWNAWENLLMLMFADGYSDATRGAARSNWPRAAARAHTHTHTHTHTRYQSMRVSLLSASLD